MISCGGFFTVCVDEEGFVWSFGANGSGQLGTGNTTDFNVPQKLQDNRDITPVHTKVNLLLSSSNYFNLQIIMGNVNRLLLLNKVSSLISKNYFVPFQLERKKENKFFIFFQKFLQFKL